MWVIYSRKKYREEYEKALKNDKIVQNCTFPVTFYFKFLYVYSLLSTLNYEHVYLIN